MWSLTPRSTTVLTLIGARPARDRSVDALQDLLERAEAAAHAREDSSIQGVEAHRHAIQAVRLQIDRMPGEQHAVGGQRDVLDVRESPSDRRPDRRGWRAAAARRR